MGEWQPIETAPKDGEPFLACHADYAGGIMEVVEYDETASTEFPWVGEAVHFPRERFTHWMPLPEAPQ